MKNVLTLSLTCMALLVATSAMANERVGDPYTLNTCPISGEKLGSMGDAPVYVGEDGKEVRFCCAGCEKKYVANKAALDEEIDKKLMADQEAHYPSNTCINSGAALKDGGVAFIAGNRLMKTCCAKCKAKVQADPAAYIAKLDEQVIAAQKDSYKGEVCPISGKDLGDSPESVVIANRLVQVCCGGCKKKVAADPVAAFEKVAAKK